jgi:hypothetical protein
MEHRRDEEDQGSRSKEAKLTKGFGTRAILIGASLIGITLCSLSIFAGISSQVTPEESPSPILPCIPFLAGSLSKTGDRFFAKIRPIVTRPLFLGISFAAILTVIAISVILSFTIPMIRSSAQQTQDIPAVEEKNFIKIAEAGASKPLENEDPKKFNWSTVVSGIIVVGIFALTIFLLIKHSSTIDSKKLFLIILVLVAVFFVVVHFENTIFPFLGNTFRQLFVKAAHSTIENLDDPL